MSPFCYRCSTGGTWWWGWRKRARATGQAQALQLSPGYQLNLFLWGGGWGEHLAALTHIPATQTSSSALPDFKRLRWPAWFGDTRESHHFHTNDFYFDFLNLAAPLPTASWLCSSVLPASLSQITPTALAADSYYILVHFKSAPPAPPSNLGLSLPLHLKGFGWCLRTVALTKALCILTWAGMVCSSRITGVTIVTYL